MSIYLDSKIICNVVIGISSAATNGIDGDSYINALVSEMESRIEAAYEIVHPSVRDQVIKAYFEELNTIRPVDRTRANIFVMKAKTHVEFKDIFIDSRYLTSLVNSYKAARVNYTDRHIKKEIIDSVKLELKKHFINYSTIKVKPFKILSSTLKQLSSDELSLIPQHIKLNKTLV